MPDTVTVGIVGLGTIGRHLARLVVDHRPGCALVGATTLDPDADGLPVHEYVEAHRASDARVSNSIASVLDAGPDVVLHATQSFLDQVLDQVLDCVDAGAHVISCTEELAFPFDRHAKLAEEIDRRARVAGVTVLGTGVNPGFLFDSLLSTVLGVCWDVERISGRRVVDVSGFGEQIHRRLGIGYTPDEFDAGHRAGSIAGHVGFPESIRIVCEALGVSLDGDVAEEFQPLVADTAAPTSYGEVAVGRTEGFVQRARGVRRGTHFVELELVLHLRPEAAGFEPVDSLHVDGTPPIDLTLRPGLDALLATSAHIVNSIPSVVAAHPGLRTVTEIAPPTAWPERLPAQVGRLLPDRPAR